MGICCPLWITLMSDANSARTAVRLKWNRKKMIECPRQSGRERTENYLSAYFSLSPSLILCVLRRADNDSKFIWKRLRRFYIRDVQYYGHQNLHTVHVFPFPKFIIAWTGRECCSEQNGGCNEKKKRKLKMIIRSWRGYTRTKYIMRRRRRKYSESNYIQSRDEEMTLCI